MVPKAAHAYTFSLYLLTIVHSLTATCNSLGALATRQARLSTRTSARQPEYIATPLYMTWHQESRDKGSTVPWCTLGLALWVTQLIDSYVDYFRNVYR